MGPRVHFSLDTLDIGNVFINSQHSYEVNIDIILLYYGILYARQAGSVKFNLGIVISYATFVSQA